MTCRLPTRSRCVPTRTTGRSLGVTVGSCRWEVASSRGGGFTVPSLALHLTAVWVLMLVRCGQWSAGLGDIPPL